MNSKEFINLFNEIANKNGFSNVFGGWVKQSPECIAVLELQKSKFGNYYQLNIKIFIQGVFGRTYMPDNSLIKSSVGHINGSVPQEYKEIFDFDQDITTKIRRERLEKLFCDFLIPFLEMALTKSGIKKLDNEQQIFLFPAVKKELEKEGI